MRLWSSAVVVALAAMFGPAVAATPKCDQACLEQIAARYRAAYVSHDRQAAPFARTVRFSENHVALQFPDGSWDTVTREVGPALTMSDPTTGAIGVFTAIMMRDTPAFLAIRLKVAGGKITEVEHLLATKRYVSSPPAVFGDVQKLVHDPELTTPLAPSEKRSRAEMIALADGYFSTLEKNDGTIRTKFARNCHRVENGMETVRTTCEDAFRLGGYAFNERVRDREYFLVDEMRGLVMGRAFIDHKGVLDVVKLTDGTQRPSVFREPHTWGVLEVFKIKDGAIGPIEANFIGVPYYMRSPWTKRTGSANGIAHR